MRLDITNRNDLLYVLNAELQLDITSKNYLSYVLDAEIHLDVMNFRNIIRDDNEAFSKKNVKIMISDVVIFMGS